MRKSIFVILSVITTGAFAQTGGGHAFDFLNVPGHARVAAMGGVNVSLADRDINSFHNNPALAGDTLDGVASAGYQFYAGDVGQALFAYAHDFENAGPFLFGVQHMGYGTLQGFDESGIETMEFNAGESAILVGKSHQIAHFRLGATLKAVFSNIAGYRANALMMDVGGIFKHPQRDFTIGLVIKNFGLVLSHYNIAGSEDLPFDVQAGVTLKPEHMPVRFSLTGYNLVRSGLLDYGVADAAPSTIKKIFSHLNFAAELLIHRNFNAMVGYNNLTHETLKTDTGGFGAGLSFGFSVSVKPVEIVVSRSGYVAGTAGYNFTLSTNINKLLKKR